MSQSFSAEELNKEIRSMNYFCENLHESPPSFDVEFGPNYVQWSHEPLAEEPAAKVSRSDEYHNEHVASWYDYLRGD